MRSATSALDNFYLQQPEPIQSTLLALRAIILQNSPSIIPAWKYGMPFFYFKNKMFCYLWVHKKYKKPYIGIVEGSKLHHPDLIQEQRARMKILLVDPHHDLPVNKINDILQQALGLYQ